MNYVPLSDLEEYFFRGSSPKLVHRLPTHVSCNKIVLYLIKDGESWAPESKTQLISMSLAWIEDRDVFVYTQVFQSGPTEICTMSCSADELETRTREIMDRPAKEFRANDLFVPRAIR